jgi:hypothetical protein
MLTSAQTSATKLSAALFLILGSSAPVMAQETGKLRLGYLASFENGSLQPALDQFDFGALQAGHSQDPNNFPSWTQGGGDLVMRVTRPADLVGGVASVGVFATENVNFGPGTVFEARATFVKPVGPHGSTDIWAMVVGARTGDNDDLFSETRVGVSLQVRGTSLRFNSPGGGPGTDLPPEVYNEIFSPTDPQPFTLELLVDRINGSGKVSIKVGDRVFSRAVIFPAFPASSGPAITAVGPSLGIVSAPGQTASVHVREFRIYAPSSSEANATDTCSEAYAGFGCRAVPNTH